MEIIRNKDKVDFLDGLDTLDEWLPMIRAVDRPFFDKTISKLTEIVYRNNLDFVSRGRLNGKTASFTMLDLSHPVYAYGKPLIDRVIFNDPATIVIWTDGSKTVVKCQPGDEYSKETGLAMCIAKKCLGNKGNFNETFKKYIEDYDNPIVDGIPRVGTLIKIIDAGYGAYCANGSTGRVTNKMNTSGRLNSDPGYHVELESGEVWRIAEDAKIKILRG